MSNFYLGVDPGGQGALALIDPQGKALEWDKMGDILDIDDFVYNAVIMSRGKLVCVFEEHKGGGPQCNANTHRSAGYYLGIFKTMCHLHHIPLHLVTPQKWKKHLGANSDKDHSIKLCEGIFPEVNLIYPRCKIKDNNTAEALLIAEYGRELKL